MTSPPSAPYAAYHNILRLPSIPPQLAQNNNSIAQYYNQKIAKPSDDKSTAAGLITTNGSTNVKRKRSWSRAVFSNLQRKGLERQFEFQKYITKPDRKKLAARLGLKDAQVKVWFQVTKIILFFAKLIN
jgi:homeobox protein HLX1